MYEFTTLDETEREKYMRGADGKQKNTSGESEIDRERETVCVCVSESE